MLSFSLALTSASLLALMWMCFLKNINFFYREKWGPMFIALFAGALAVLPVLVLPQFDFNGFSSYETRLWLGVMINIALQEELSKSLLLLAFFLLFRSKFKEPASYIIFSSLVALGFATFENVLYFSEFGSDIVFSRGVMSIFVHIACTSFVGYGLYNEISRTGVSRFLMPLAGFLSAVLLHTCFDFVLMYDFPPYSFLGAFAFFLMAVEMWAVMFNNQLNRSAHFRDDLVLDMASMRRLMVIMFLFTLALKFISSITLYGVSGIIIFFAGLSVEILLGYVLFNRITRFVVIKDHHRSVRPEFPLSFRGFDYSGIPGFRMSLRIRGLEFNEFLFTRHMKKPLMVRPINFKNSQIGNEAELFMKEKYYFGSDMIIYEVTFNWADDPMPDDLNYYLVPKTSGETNKNGLPIVALMATENPYHSDAFIKERPKFYGWLVLLPEVEKKSVFSILSEAIRESAQPQPLREPEVSEI